MSYNDDFVKAVFLYTYGHGKPLKENDEYQRYFVYNYEISNPRRYHEQLIKSGDLQPSPISDIMSAYKVSELKEICGGLGLSKTGKKQELINRIALLPASEQKKLVNKKHLYSLSEKGAAFLNAHIDFVELHKHSWEIELDEYIETKQALGFDGKFRDVAWAIFNQRIIKYAKSKQYGLLRNNYLHMSWLMKEEKNYKETLKYLLYVLYFDVCGAEMAEYLKYYDSKEDAIERCQYHCCAFSTVIPSYIAELQEYYDESFVDTIYSQYKTLPINLCDIHTFKKLVEELLTSSTVDAETYEKMFISNYKAYMEKFFSAKERRSPPSPVKVQKSGGCLAGILTLCLFIAVSIKLSI